MKDLCFKCRKKNGFERKDDGAHTAIVKKCDGCGEIKTILHSRHWVKKQN